MVEFLFKDTNMGYGVEYNGKIIYECNNRTKGFAFDEANSYCSSFQGAVLIDKTFRMLAVYKVNSNLTMKELDDKLNNQSDIQYRIRYMDVDSYIIEEWGYEHSSYNINDIWRAM